MSDRFTELRALIEGAGYGFVDLPIVHEASVFVELAGEDLRRRLYLTSNAEGTELALRPDFTIPVCLHHLATGPAARRADYAYLGPVFRQRAPEPDEFLQAGVESLGRTDRGAADAAILKLALDAVALLGVRRPTVRIGDSAIFAALLDALDLSDPWQRRLARAFGDADRLKNLIARAADGEAQAAADDGALAGAGGTRLRQAVGERLAAAGLATIGGRTAAEIADRYLEKSALAAGIGARQAAVLAGVVGVAGRPDAALAELQQIARADRIAIGPALDRFARRLDAFAAAGIDPGRLAFAADFGRRLDYYTGFVFEIFRGRASKSVAGGGRYDRLLAHVGAGGAVPEGRFAISLHPLGAQA